MSAIKTVSEIATNKGVSMDFLAEIAGYALPQHLKRALTETPGNIGAKRIVKLAKALDLPSDRMLMILVNGK